MKVYIVNVASAALELDLPYYAATKGDAHDWVKGNVPKTYFAETTVTEAELRADKPGVVLALNGQPEFTPGSTWGITPRGGLKAD